MRWSPASLSRDVPLYRAIADAIAGDMAAGRLEPGAQLPTQRDLARQLGVDLTTVTRGYAEAAGRGLIVSEGRRGSFVRSRGSLAPPAGAGAASEAASGMNMPPEPEGDLLRQRIRDGLADLLADRAVPLGYQPAGGNEAQRASAASLLAQSVPGTMPDQTLLTAGGQNALQAVLSLLLSPGDRIAAAGCTYPGFLSVARSLGARIVPLPMDRHGILPDALEQAARAAPLHALYVIPTNDNPTTATLPAARRKEIAAIAGRHGFAIVEDDAYGRLPADPLPPIARFAPDRTWHILSVSKLVSPSLRVGFLRAPTAADTDAAAARLHQTAVMAPPLNAGLVTRWIDDGTFPRLVGAVRKEAEVRMSGALALLEGFGAAGQPEGYHLWLPLEGRDAGRIAAEAIYTGLPAVPGSAFAADEAAPAEALRISLGGSAPRSRMLSEIRRLAALLDRPGSAPGRNFV